MDNLIARAVADPRHIVLSEGEDPRVIDGAVMAARHGVARITLLGDPDVIRKRACDYGDNHYQITIIDPGTSPRIARYSEEYHRIRHHKGIDLKTAEQATIAPLNFANMMVRMGDADGSVGGAVHTTPEVVRAALQIIGTAPRYSLVSSFFLMIMDDAFNPVKRNMIFTDCGLVIDPTEDELAQIASAAADNAALLLGAEPKLALLSFSTGGSAQHAFVDKMTRTGAKLKALRPELAVDTAVQFDAAIVPEVAAVKSPKSKIKGRANVLVFPDLNAGNIGYKIAERLGGAKAIGPVLQGLKSPANDLSRGCDAEAVFNMIVVTVIQAQMADNQNGHTVSLSP